jgi:hypothetical protein
MRDMTGTYLLVIVVGLSLLGVAAGILSPFGEGRNEPIRQLVLAPMGPWTSFIAIPLYAGLVAYSVRELVRPRPRRI